MKPKFSKKPRKSKKVFKKQNKKAAKVKATTELVTYMAPRRMPFPPRYRTKFTCSLYGAIPSGSASGQYDLALNFMNLPFNGTSPIPGANPAVATLQPTGLTQIWSVNLYRAYRVYGSQIKIEFQPQALTDSVEVTVTPSLNVNTPANTGVAMAQPYTKNLMFSSSKANTSRNNGQLVNYITQHKFLGVSKRAIEDDLSGSYADNINPPDAIAVQLYWVVNWATPDAVNLATACSIRATLTYYVELYDIVNATVVDT